MEFENVITLKQWFYKDVKNIAAFYFYFTNMILLLMNDYREGKFYCFCHKMKKKCILCKMSYDFSRMKRKGEECLERYQHNFDELKKLADEMCTYFEECFNFYLSSLDFFNK